MKIHWFSITVFNSYEYCLDLWENYFSDSLGFLQSSVRAGRGFSKIDVALNEAKLYSFPIVQRDTLTVDYCHFEFTGSACDCVVPTNFRDFVEFLQSDGVLFKVTRLDLAFDNVPFTPRDFFEKVSDGELVSLVKRDTLTFTSSPFALREDGEKGSDTCYLGSRQSERFIRVYNQRGYTRLEFVCKDERAQLVCLDLFSLMYLDWDFTGREHVAQYVNFPNWSVWLDWLHNARSADVFISSARRVSLSKLEGWLDRQVSVALSVLVDVHGVDDGYRKIQSMIERARKDKDRSRYASVLQIEKPFIELSALNVPDIHELIYSLEFPSPVPARLSEDE